MCPLLVLIHPCTFQALAIARCMKNFHFFNTSLLWNQYKVQKFLFRKIDFHKRSFHIELHLEHFFTTQKWLFQFLIFTSFKSSQEKGHKKAKTCKADLLSEGFPKMDWDKLSSASAPPRRPNKGDICSAWWESTQHNKPWNLILFLQLYLYLYLLVFVFVSTCICICICICIYLYLYM